MVKTTLLLLLSAVGAVYDLKTRRIPNWLTFGTLLVALIVSICNLKIELIINCLLGFLVGIALLFVPYLLGAMGAGDVKLLGAIGAIVGFKDVILIFFYSTVCGLFLSLIWIISNPGHFKFLITTWQVLPTVDKKQKFPYGIALFLGTILYIILGTNNFLNNVPLNLKPWQ